MTPTDAQIEQLRAQITAHPSYRLAEDDLEFLESDAARAVRLALEFHRTETYLQAAGIESTVVVFGSARVPAPESGLATPRQVGYYEEGRRFGFELS